MFCWFDPSHRSRHARTNRSWWLWACVPLLEQLEPRRGSCKPWRYTSRGERSRGRNGLDQQEQGSSAEVLELAEGRGAKQLTQTRLICNTLKEPRTMKTWFTPSAPHHNSPSSVPSLRNSNRRLDSRLLPFAPHPSRSYRTGKAWALECRASFCIRDTGNRLV